MPAPRTQLLELIDVLVVRDGTPILQVDRLSLGEGERVAVLGPNGSGKSTLVGLLMRDLRPVDRPGPPPVLLRGTELWDLLEARALFGVVTSAWQELHARPVTVHEVVLSGFFGSVGLTPFQDVRPEQVDAAGRALREAGIERLAGRTMETLSTGEARRALIARALVHDPPVLVLDEPYAGLDPAARKGVGESVRSLLRSGRGLLLVTHHVEDIPPEVTRAVLLKEGRVVADGPKEEVLTSARLSVLFDCEVRLEERGGAYRLW